VCAGSGTCKSTADSEETVVLQYGIGRSSAGTQSTAAEVTLSGTSRGLVRPPTSPVPVMSLHLATTADTVNHDTSTASALQCTNWTDIDQLR